MWFSEPFDKAAVGFLSPFGDHNPGNVG